MSTAHVSSLRLILLLLADADIVTDADAANDADSPSILLLTSANAHVTSVCRIATFGASVQVYQRNVRLSTFLHALVHFLGNLSSIIMYCGNLPDYRQAWYTQIQSEQDAP